jgi:hypothetical protein
MTAGLETNIHRRALPITLRQARVVTEFRLLVPDLVSALGSSTHSIGHQRHRPAFDSAAGQR